MPLSNKDDHARERWSSNNIWSGEHWHHSSSNAQCALENDLRAVLHNASRIVPIESTKTAVADVVDRYRPFSVVPEVEKLNPDLGPNVLSQGSILEQGDVGIPNCRSCKRISTEIAVPNYISRWVRRQRCYADAGGECVAIQI